MNRTSSASPALASASATRPSRPATAWTGPRWIAHRGAGMLAPENTLAAFRLGARLGWRAYECDVKLSADGVPFLLHDATLGRTSNGRGSAGALTWDALSRLDAGSWHSRTYAGEPLPTLAAVAAFVHANGLHLNLEIKPTPGTEAPTGRAVAEAVRRLWAGAPAPPLLSSFSLRALHAARDGAPELPRALLLDRPRRGWLECAAELACGAVVTHHRWMDASLLRQLRDAGLQALVYTVNEPDEAARLLSLGVDGIITDAVDRFTPD